MPAAGAWGESASTVGLKSEAAGYGENAGFAGLNDPNDTEAPPLIDIDGWVQDSPPWLASAVLHLLAMITLGLLFGREIYEQPLVLEAAYADDEGEQLFDESLELDAEVEVELEQTFSPTLLPELEAPLALPQLAIPTPTGNLLSSSKVAPNVGVAFRGRTEAYKRVLLKTFGGTATTEKAVLEGLRWLARNQRTRGKKRGSWSLKGPYKDGAKTDENEMAATAMALLAFQGAGHTHQMPPERPFAKTVADGWDWLLLQQSSEGTFFNETVGFNHAIYTQAQATIALCELYAITGDAELREPAQRAVDYLVKVQSSNGGWRYEPGEGGDLSVTGWVVMALQSARIAGLEVPSKTFFDVRRFIDSCQSDGGSKYGYTPRDGPRLSMTAEGLLCRQYMGWKQTDPRLEAGAFFLLENLPSWTRGRRDVYYWYYATQVLHHMEGQYWQEWNRVMRDLLPRHQQVEGREAGSWGPEVDERHGRTGGRLYTTCLSIFILEVYYRHLPIYQQDRIGGL